MVYSRKMLKNDERRQQIAKELKNVVWEMKIRSVADTYVFFEHPDFKDHVFCSASIIPSRPLTVGQMMHVEVELAYDNARDSWGYVAKSAMRPQDNLVINRYKTDFENLAGVVHRLLSRAKTVENAEEWKKKLPAGWDWPLEFTLEHEEELNWVSNMMVQCGALVRLHGAPKLRTVEGILEVLGRYPRELQALQYQFQKALDKAEPPVGHHISRREIGDDGEDGDDSDRPASRRGWRRRDDDGGDGDPPVSRRGWRGRDDDGGDSNGRPASHRSWRRRDDDGGDSSGRPATRRNWRRRDDDGDGR